MGLLQWFRGNGDTATAALSAAMAELEGFVNPGRKRQTELVEELKNKRHDIGNGTPPDIDLIRGIAIIRLRPKGAPPASAPPASAPPASAPPADAASPEPGPPPGS